MREGLSRLSRGQVHLARRRQQDPWDGRGQQVTPLLQKSLSSVGGTPSPHPDLQEEPWAPLSQAPATCICSATSDLTATPPSARPLAAPISPPQFPQVPPLFLACPSMCVYGGGVHAICQATALPGGTEPCPALPGLSDDRSLPPAACQVLQQGTACSLSHCCGFYVCGFLSVDPAPSTSPSSRSSRKILELEEPRAFPSSDGCLPGPLGPGFTWINGDTSSGSSTARRRWPRISQ